MSYQQNTAANEIGGLCLRICLYIAKEAGATQARGLPDETLTFMEFEVDSRIVIGRGVCCEYSGCGRQCCILNQ